MSRQPALRVAASPSPLWVVCGHRAVVGWSAADGLYTACLPSVPGCFGRGETRTAALAALAAILARGDAAVSPEDSRVQ